MASQQVVIPDLGSDDDVDVIEVLVAVGDTVAVDQSLVVLESAKASMEVPSSHAGKVLSVAVVAGDKVRTGSVVLELALEELEAASDSVSRTDNAGNNSGNNADNVSNTDRANNPDVARAEPPVLQTSVLPMAAQAESTVAQAVQSLVIPDLGSDDPVEVIEVLVKAGDRIELDQSLVVLESAKASMEVPSTAVGTVLEVKLHVGDKINSGAVILLLAGVSDAAIPALTSATEAAEPAVVVESTSLIEQASATEQTGIALSPQAVQAADLVRTESAQLKPTRQLAPAQTVQRAEPSEPVYAGPAVRKLARELGVVLDTLQGSGPKGRIVQEDVHAYVKERMEELRRSPITATSAEMTTGIPPIPAVDFSRFGPVEKIALSRIDKLTRDNMHRAWLNVPHVSQWDEADVTELEVFRESLKPAMDKRGIRITPLAFLLKAAAAALLAEPKFNRSLDADGEHVVQKQYVHIGIAVDTPQGLLVPVLRDVDKKGLWQIADESQKLAVKARAGKLSPAEMQGACFTLSSLGAMGGNGFTPIVNAPEVAILGVSKTQVKPVWNGSEFVPRSLLPLVLSYDHRAINGADAGRFMTYLVQVIGDLRQLLL